MTPATSPFPPDLPAIGTSRRSGFDTKPRRSDVWRWTRGARRPARRDKCGRRTHATGGAAGSTGMVGDRAGRRGRRLWRGTECASRARPHAEPATGQLSRRSDDAEIDSTAGVAPRRVVGPGRARGARGGTVPAQASIGVFRTRPYDEPATGQLSRWPHGADIVAPAGVAPRGVGDPGRARGARGGTVPAQASIGVLRTRPYDEPATGQLSGGSDGGMAGEWDCAPVWTNPAGPATPEPATGHRDPVGRRPGREDRRLGPVPQAVSPSLRASRAPDRLRHPGRDRQRLRP
jgi:hypothetical protein